MTIQLNINVSGESAGEVRNELQSLLNGLTAYRGEPINAVAGANTGAQQGTVGEAGNAIEPKMTATQKKAAEKAAIAAAAAQAASNIASGYISTGEERTDPEADKADAADEAADTKASTPDPVKLTHDSVRAMLGGYVQAYGMTAAQEDGTKIIKVPKISDLKDTPAALAKAVIAVATAIEKNPHNREIAGDGIMAEKLAELKPLVTAAMAVK